MKAVNTIRSRYELSLYNNILEHEKYIAASYRHRMLLCHLSQPTAEIVLEGGNAGEAVLNAS